MIAMLHHAGDPYMREREADFLDVRNRIIGNLLGDGGQRTVPAIDRPSVIVADNISPSDAVALPRRFIRGMDKGRVQRYVAVLLCAVGVYMVLTGGG